MSPHFFNHGNGDEFIKDALKCITDLRDECNKVGLESSVSQIDRIERCLKTEGVGAQQHIPLLNDLRGNIQQELAKKKCFILDSRGVHFYYDSFISQQVKDCFPSAWDELSESGKCAAFDRPSASIFHSMRALEVGLACLATALHVNSQSKNWENIINDCEKAIKGIADQSPRPEKWKDDKQFYSECATEFRYFKEAWRNHVTHRRIGYGGGQAADILQSTHKFMQHLSSRLKE